MCVLGGWRSRFWGVFLGGVDVGVLAFSFLAANISFDYDPSRTAALCVCIILLVSFFYYFFYYFLLSASTFIGLPTWYLATD